MTLLEMAVVPESLTNHNFLLMIAGPTACGKDSVISAICENYPWVKKIISYTTRIKRPKDVEGVDYHFIPKEDFLARKDDFVFMTDRKMGQETVHYGMEREDLLAVASGGSYVCHLDLASFHQIPEEITRAARGDEKLANACLRHIYPVYLGIPRLTMLKERYFARHRVDDEKLVFLSRLEKEWQVWNDCQDQIPFTVMNGEALGITTNQVVGLINQFAE